MIYFRWFYKIGSSGQKVLTVVTYLSLLEFWYKTLIFGKFVFILSLRKNIIFFFCWKEIKHFEPLSVSVWKTICFFFQGTTVISNADKLANLIMFLFVLKRISDISCIVYESILYPKLQGFDLWKRTRNYTEHPDFFYY